MFQMAKVVCVVAVFLFAFTANFDAGMLINPFDPPSAEAKKKDKKGKNIRKIKTETRAKIKAKIKIREKTRTRINREGLGWISACS